MFEGEQLPGAEDYAEWTKNPSVSGLTLRKASSQLNTCTRIFIICLEISITEISNIYMMIPHPVLGRCEGSEVMQMLRSHRVLLAGDKNTG